MAIDRFERVPIVLAEISDRTVARPQALQQPHHLDIALRFVRQTASGSHPIHVAVQVELQKIGRIIGRLAWAAAFVSVPKPELGHV